MGTFSKSAHIRLHLISMALVQVQSGRRERPREMFRRPCSRASSELQQLGMHDHTGYI